MFVHSGYCLFNYCQKKFTTKKSCYYYSIQWQYFQIMSLLYYLDSVKSTSMVVILSLLMLMTDDIDDDDNDWKESLRRLKNLVFLKL